MELRATSGASRHEYVVLVVDNDVAMQFEVAYALRKLGVRVVGARSLAHARAFAGMQVDAVVADRHLPDGDSTDVHTGLRRSFPHAVFVLHTAADVPPGTSSAARGDFERLVELVVPSWSEKRIRDEAELVGEVTGLWLARWPEDQRSTDTESIAVALVAELVEVIAERDPSFDDLTRRSLDLAADVGALDVVMARVGSLRAVLEAALHGTLDARSESMFVARLSRAMQHVITVVTEAALERIRSEALVDPLTGLGNRRALEQDLDRAQAVASRHGHPLTLAMIDVDGLKRINDECGHEAGDRALKAMADALTEGLRGGDRAYRYGGDEFLLVLPDTIATDAGFLESRLANAGAPSCSVGLATYPSDALDELVAIADTRMYETRRRRRELDRRGAA